jgi:hypothetical protein
LSLKEEDLIFKENKLNIGDAFRKKNFVNNYGNSNNQMGGVMTGMGGLGGINVGMNSGMGNINAMGGGGHLQGANSFLDPQMNNMHHMASGMNGLAGVNNGMHHHGMGMGGMGGHLGMNGMSNSGTHTLGGMNGMNGFGGMNGLNSLNGMNLN